MHPEDHSGHHHQARSEAMSPSSAADAMPTARLNRLAFAATAHCLAGCAIGEVLGMVIGTSLHWSNAATVAISVVLAFVFGYALTMRPLLASGLATGVVLRWRSPPTRPRSL